MTSNHIYIPSVLNWIWKGVNTSWILNNDPEKWHHNAMDASKFAEQIPYFTEALKEQLSVNDLRLHRELGNLELKNPIWLAAGMLKQSYGLRLREALGFGYLVIGGLTVNAQPWNQKPRIFKFPDEQSMVNGMGLPGDWIDAEIARLAKRKGKGMMPNIPIIANLCTSAGNATLEGKIWEFKLLMEKLYPYVQGFEINVSCPNQWGVCSMQEAENIEEIIKSTTEYNKELALKNPNQKEKALLIKISPLTSKEDDEIEDLTQEGLQHLAALCEKYEVTGITATNTSKEHDFKKQTQIRTADNKNTFTWWLSGKQLYDRSLATVEALRRETKLPIIGVGGIGYDTTWNDLLAMEKAGADVSQILSSVVQWPHGPLTPYYLNKTLLEKAL